MLLLYVLCFKCLQNTNLLPEKNTYYLYEAYCLIRKIIFKKYNKSKVFHHHLIFDLFLVLNLSAFIKLLFFFKKNHTLNMLTHQIRILHYN